MKNQQVKYLSRMSCKYIFKAMESFFASQKISSIKIGVVIIFVVTVFLQGGCAGLGLDTNNASLLNIIETDTVKAKRIFNNYAEKQGGYKDFSKLKEVSRKYKSINKKPNKYEREEILNAITPFLDIYSSSSQKEDYSVIVFPGEKIKLKLTSYCLDKNKPAPKTGEVFRLESVNTVIPKELRKTYRSLLVSAASSKNGYDNTTQDILWYIRNKIEIKQPIKISDLNKKNKNRLFLASPQVESAIKKYNKNLLADELLGSIFKAAREKNRNLDKMLGKVDSISNDFSGSVDQVVKRLESLPVSGKIDQNKGYTLLSPGVAARTYSPNGGLKSITTEVVNTSYAPYRFAPLALVAISPRQVQRMGIQPGIGLATTNPAGASAAVIAGLLYPLIHYISQDTNYPGRIRTDEEKRRDSKEGMRDKDIEECVRSSYIVDVAKSVANSLGRCKKGMSRKELEAREAAWLQLMTSRVRHNERCFGGGDETHQDEVAKAIKNLERCRAYLGKNPIWPTNK